VEDDVMGLTIFQIIGWSLSVLCLLAAIWFAVGGKPPRSKAEPVRPIVLVRRDTAECWERIDPVLRWSEPGLDTTTGEVRIGDGQTPWTALDIYRGSPDDPFAHATEPAHHGRHPHE
jgi:hypothetical protein